MEEWGVINDLIGPLFLSVCLFMHFCGQLRREDVKARV